MLLDCCHAQYLARGESFHDKAIAASWPEGLDERLGELRARAAQRKLGANPSLVRLSATEADQFAFEHESEVNGRRAWVGIFTQSLQRVFHEFETLGVTRVTWRQVMASVREHVISAVAKYGHARQEPRAEGPDDRFVFETERAPRRRALIFCFDDKQPALRLAEGCVDELLLQRAEPHPRVRRSRVRSTERRTQASAGRAVHRHQLLPQKFSGFVRIPQAGCSENRKQASLTRCCPTVRVSPSFGTDRGRRRTLGTWRNDHERTQTHTS